MRVEGTDYRASDWVHVGCFWACKSAEWYTSVKLIKYTYSAFEAIAHGSLARLLEAPLNSLYSGPSYFRH